MMAGDSQEPNEISNPNSRELGGELRSAALAILDVLLSETFAGNLERVCPKAS